MSVGIMAGLRIGFWDGREDLNTFSRTSGCCWRPEREWQDLRLGTEECEEEEEEEQEQKVYKKS